MTENAERKQPRRGGGAPFKPGRSGNPAGKPPGARNKATMAIEQLLEGEAAAITRKCLEMAKNGDGLAIRLVMERIAPVRRGRPVRFTVPPMGGLSDLVAALGGVLSSVASGELTPDEGSTVAGILDAKRRAIETVEIDARLALLERAAAERGR